MSNHLTDTLDIALDRLKADEPVPDILAGQPDQAGGLDSLLHAAVLLQNLAPMEMPAAADWQVDRQQFLADLAHVRPQAVPAGRLVRLKGWIVHTLPEQLSLLTYPWKEQRRMSALLIKATLIFGLIFGSVGSTAVLAAGSLPDSPLYPLKLAMEQTRLAMASQPEDQAGLHLSLARVRAREMAQLAQGGGVPDAATLDRLQHHLNQSLNLAAQMPDEPMHGLLTQARQMVQAQELELAQTRAQVSQPAGAALDQANGLLNRAGQDIEMGLQDPQTFRWRHTHHAPPEAAPQPTLTPEPEPDLPGSGPGCPPGDCPPAGDEHHTGQASDTLPPGPGGPGDNTHQPCDGDHCPPAGDEHHHATQPEPPNGGSTGDLTGPGGGGDHHTGGGGMGHDNGGDSCCQDNHSSDSNHSGPRR